MELNGEFIFVSLTSVFIVSVTSQPPDSSYLWQSIFFSKWQKNYICQVQLYWYIKFNCVIHFPTPIQVYGKIKMTVTNSINLTWPSESLNPFQPGACSSVCTQVWCLVCSIYMSSLSAPDLGLVGAGPQAVIFCVLLYINVSVLLSHFTLNSSNSWLSSGHFFLYSDAQYALLLLFCDLLEYSGSYLQCLGITFM